MGRIPCIISPRDSALLHFLNHLYIDIMLRSGWDRLERHVRESDASRVLEADGDHLSVSSRL